MARIGFMQGRFSPIVNGRIQSFPWGSWREEFALGEQNGFELFEWTLDQERLYENPLLTPDGQAEIRELCEHHRMTIPSLTGDCFMQAPFWKKPSPEREALLADFRLIVKACAAVGISIVVIPLVDNGRIERPDQEDVLVAHLQDHTSFLIKNRVRVVFESDFVPAELARFIGRLDSGSFGVNYDIGNSASLGYDPAEEIGAYGHRILNVHIKDRKLGGTTVPLGTGNADFETVFASLADAGYRGNYILQTARAEDGRHAAALCRYRDMAQHWLERYAA